MFFSHNEYVSSKNGIITVTKSPCSSPSISVKGCMQSGSYIIGMWKYACKQLPQAFAPKSILMFGLGGGNAIKVLQKKYPDVAITVIEWDEVMLDLAYKLKLFTNTDTLTIKHADAFEIIRTEVRKYDLIIVDLFTGDSPPLALTEDMMLTSLKDILSNDGYMLVNFFKHKDYMYPFSLHFLNSTIVTYKYNILGLYSKEVMSS